MRTDCELINLHGNNLEIGCAARRGLVPKAAAGKSPVRRNTANSGPPSFRDIMTSSQRVL